MRQLRVARELGLELSHSLHLAADLSPVLLTPTRSGRYSVVQW